VRDQERAVRIDLEDDKQADETWVECVVQDLWDIVKRVRRRKGKREERYTLSFGPNVVEVTVRRVTP
jgi:uncharacterized protein YceH (UPF0502 family)